MPGQESTKAPASPDASSKLVLRRWLEDFAAAVRDEDYEQARQLFDPEVAAFGTRAAAIHGLDQLVEDQWRPIWSVTQGFTYLFDQMHLQTKGDLAWIAVPWTSQFRQSGKPRFGRATYILQFRHGRWRAVHSHHSINP